jgi:enoyl-CoA hydratase/carnithine racemase
MPPSLSRDGDVFVLDLGDDENRFNPDWVGGVNAALDEVEAAPAPRALVTTATGKVWSNGLDLDWFAANVEAIPAFLAEVHGLFARVLTIGVPTVAALQGHTFAAGAMLSLAHDQRVMRADRGYWCLPEVDINIPFTHGMNALIKARLSKATAHEAMTTGRRYGGVEAEQAGIVNAAVGEDEVRSRAIALAAPLAPKNAVTLGVIKGRMYEATVTALHDTEANQLAAPS